MLRSKIRKLTAELSKYKMNCHTEETHIIINDVWESIRANDDKAIEIYESFGPTARHRIMNINEYRRGFVLGFEDFKFGEYNWMKRVVFLNLEKISLKQPKERNIYEYNHFTLGETPNGSWGYGYHYTFGNGGSSGSCLSVYNTFYPTKEECTIEALKFLKKNFEEQLSRMDCSKSQRIYCQNILNVLNEKLKPKLNYAVNKKGQILLF